jgi:hypothetical protein
VSEDQLVGHRDGYNGLCRFPDILPLYQGSHRLATLEQRIPSKRHNEPPRVTGWNG